MFRWPLVLPLLVTACAGKALDVGRTATVGESGSTVASGSNDDGGGGGETFTSTIPGPSDPTPLVGTWNGYVEAAQFPSGSDAMLLAFTKGTDESVSGKITYGQGTPPPPAIDASSVYPSSAFWSLHDAPALIEGFAYSTLGGSLDGTRLQFRTNAVEAWTSWCALQTPTNDGWPAGVFQCLPNGGGMG